MGITVRRATPHDADAIAGFALKLVDQHVGYDPVRFSHIGDRDGMARYYAGRSGSANAVVLVAEAEERLIGFAYLEYEPILYAELAVKVGWLHDIFVDADARAAGAGRMLIEAVAREAKRLGANKVLLSVAAKNVAASEFFGRVGFAMTMHEMMLRVDQ